MRAEGFRLALLAGCGSGALLYVAHSPSGSPWWAPVALVPALLAARTLRPLPLLVLAAVTSLGVSLQMYQAAVLLAPVALPLLVLMFVPQVLLPLTAVRLPGGAVAIAGLTASVWTLMEVLASQVSILGGAASIYSFAYSQFDSPLMPLVSLSGTSLLAFLLVLVNVLVAEAVAARSPKVLWPAAAGVLIAAAPLDAGGGQLTVTVVQPAFQALELAHAAVDPGAARGQLHVLEHLSEGADGVVVWPETSVQPGLVPVSAGSLLYGVALDTNAVMMGDEVVFSKLVPLGIVESSRFTRGTYTVGLDRHQGVLVCLDSAHARPALLTVRGGARFLIVMASSAFAGPLDTAVHHLRISAFRAVENDVPLVYLASGGPSAHVDASGRVVARTARGAQQAATFHLTAGSGSTPYNRHGDWFGLLACPLLGAVSYRAARGYGAARGGPRTRRG